MNNKPVYTSVAQLKSKKSEKLLQGSLHTSRKNKSNKCASVEVADKSKEDFVRGDVKIVRVGEETIVTTFDPELKTMPERTSHLTNRIALIENPITRTVGRKFSENRQQIFSTKILTNKKEVKKIDYDEISNQSSTLALMQSLKNKNKGSFIISFTSFLFMNSYFLFR